MPRIAPVSSVYHGHVAFDHVVVSGVTVEYSLDYVHECVCLYWFRKCVVLLHLNQYCVMPNYAVFIYAS